MSGFDLAIFDRLVQGICPEYQPSLFSELLVALNFYPIYLTVGMYAISLYHVELYLALISFALTLDWLLNWGLRSWIQQPPPTAGCGSTYEMPSFASEDIMCFTIMLVTFTLVWRLYVSPWKLCILSIVLALIIYARLDIGFNTPAQLIAGAFIGSVEGVVYQLLIYHYIYPHFNRILSWRILVLSGFDDTLCRTPAACAIKEKDYSRTYAEPTVREVYLEHKNASWHRFRKALRARFLSPR